MSDRKKDAKTIPERIVRLETEMVNLCDDISAIMNNHLPHLENKIDRLADKVEQNIIQSKENTVRLAFVIPIIMTVVQIALNFFAK